MPKLPSLQQLLTGFEKTLKRFPLEILVSIVGSVSFILIIRDRLMDEKEEQVLLRLMLVSIMALTLLLSASVYAERKNIAFKNAVLLRGLAFTLVVGLFFFLDPIESEVSAFRCVFIFVAFHLLVSFAPFIGEKSVGAFWEYNKRLFLRILLSALYSTVLFAGLCIALLCIDTLFNADLNERTYAYLAAVIYGIFNTVFFLAGVPSDWTELDGEHVYPKGLKIFTQFVLIPLATIYFCILLVYEGKLILTWSLPQGLVSSLVLGYAVYGILSILLVYPIRDEADNRWIKSFFKLFYVLLIPLIILLGIAIFTRIIEYGITEPRYILVVLSFWLTGITIYFLVSRSENIKIIPISLCIVALAAVWGPQSATAVSIRSQMNELTKLFERNGVYHNDKFQKLSDTTSSEDNNQADDIVLFLIKREDFEAFRGKTNADIDSLDNKVDKNIYTRAETINGLLGIRAKFSENGRDYYYAHSESDTVEINSYHYLIAVNGYSENSMLQRQDDKLSLRLVTATDTADFNLQELFQKVKADRNSSSKLETKNLNVTATSRRAIYKLVLQNVQFSVQGKNYRIESFNGYLLIRNQ